MRTYELAFHLTPDTEEAALAVRVGELESLVKQQGGTVAHIRDPKKTHLSYPVAHKHYGYFGVVEFSAEAEAIALLDAQLKLQDGVLRFLITQKPELKEIRSLGDRLKRQKIQVAPTHRHVPEIKKEKTEEKKIEKELESALEKIT